MKTVEFNQKTYLVEPGVGAPGDAVNPADLSGPEQIELHNLLVSNIGAGKEVRKFSDRKTGAKRVIDKLVRYGELVEAEEAGDDEPEQAAPKKKAKAEKKDDGERKKRGMRFVFPFNGQEHLRTLRNTDTLRGKCVDLLKSGATFKQVEDLVVEFDKERGKPSEHVERRAYELVRLMHYYLGYGIEHDQATGVIKLHTRPVGSK